VALLNLQQSRLRLAAGALLVASVLSPLVTSFVEVSRGWMPVADTAIIALRARDVFTEDTPLLGQPSVVGARLGEQVHHPGPLEFWFIAVGQQINDHPTTSLVVVALVNAVSACAALWWLLRLGGVRVVAMGATILVTVLWSIRGEMLVNPLNPFAAIVPLAAYLVCMVAAGSGRPWALVWGVVFGSYAAQAHLTVTGPVVAAAVAVLISSLASWVTTRHGAARVAETPSVAPARRPALVALALLALVWAGPLTDVVVNRGGNLAALGSTGAGLDESAIGWERATSVTVRAVAPWPVWMRPTADTRTLLIPSVPAQAALVLGLWFLGLVCAARLRDRAPAVGLAFTSATAVLAAGTLLMTRMPDELYSLASVGNFVWLWPASALLWGASMAGVIGVVAIARPRLGTPVALLGVVLTCGVGVASAITPVGRPIVRAEAAYVRALAPQVARALDPSAAYVLDLERRPPESQVVVGLLHELVRRDLDVRVNGSLASFGRRRRTLAGATGGTLVVQRGNAMPEPPLTEARLVGSHTPSVAVTQALAIAEQSMADRIERAGGPVQLIALPGLGVEGLSALEMTRGPLLGLEQAGLLRPEVSSWPETTALVRARAAPVDHVTVHILPPPSSTEQQR